MGAGTGTCCCGDEAPPGGSSLSNSRSSVPRTVSCSSCPGVLLPEILTLTIIPIDGFDPYLNCTTKASNICVPPDGGMVSFLLSPPTVLYSKGASSCDYVTDCGEMIPTKNTTVINGCKSGCNSFQCDEDTALGPQTSWIAYRVNEGIAVRFAFTSIPPPASCPPIASRDPFVNVMECYNSIAFSCNPFYHEFECAFVPTFVCAAANIVTLPPLLPPFCEGCCLVLPNWRIKMKVIVS